MGTKYAILSNVSEIDPRVYKSSGSLPGVKIDRRNWRSFFNQLGFVVTQDMENTTKLAFGQAIQFAANKAKEGDLVVIQHSGHGSQLQDTDGDEEDGEDEVICLFDGTLLDDVIFNLLSMFSPGVNVVLITDTCHSGTMFRSVAIDRITKPRASTSNLKLNCTLVAIGTCSDLETSADTQNGGAGSNALLKTFEASTTYAEWAIKAQEWLRRNRFAQNLSLNTINADVHWKPLALIATDMQGLPLVPEKSPIAKVTVTLANGKVVTIE